MSGVLRPDSGRIALDGEEVNFRGPLEARAKGVESVYQDLALVPELDVAQNVFLGREKVHGPVSLFRLRRKEMRELTLATMAELDIDIPSIAAHVRYLSGGQRQAVAVARGVMWAKKVILLDEPTAALDVAGRATVLRLIRHVRSKGLAVLVISHNLPEVFEVSDSIQVLRHGRHVATRETAQTDGNEIVALMTGLLKT